MDLFSQVQAFIGSILFGGIVSLLWIFLETFVKEFKHSFFRLIFEIPFFLVSFYLYDMFLIYVIEGILNVFYLVAIVIGIFLYFKFYNYYFSRAFEKLKIFIKTKIIKPIYLKLKAIKDILKMRIKKAFRKKKKRYERRKKKKQNI